MGINPHAQSRDYTGEGCRLENGGSHPKTNFKQVLDHLPRFENYTFFDFQKKFIQLQPTTYGSRYVATFDWRKCQRLVA